MSAARLTLTVLRRRAEFLVVAASGTKWVAPAFIMQFAKTPVSVTSAEPDGFVPSGIRLGLTASTKVGNAVVRNRARRRLRALAHDVLTIHAKAGYDFVLIARAGMEAHSYAALEQEMLKALKRLKLLRVEPIV